MTLPQDITEFEGDWLLDRVIDDRLTGQKLRAEGGATLRRSEGGLTYDEQVTLFMPGQPPFHGTRRYLWRPGPGGIAIHFEDGRFFHHLTLGQVAPGDHHDCPPDSYDAGYDFARWPLWRVRWTVKGPRKDYEMVTDFRRR